MPETRTVAELKLGDVVQWFDGPFGTAIVVQATDKEIKLFRPYGTTAAFEYGDHMTIPYTGHETGTYFRDSKQTFLVYHREEQR